MNIHVDSLFLALLALLIFESAAGIRGGDFRPFFGDIIRVRMFDGSNYEGIVNTYPDSEAALLFKPNQTLYNYFYFIRTAEAHHYMALLAEVAPFHQHIPGEHSPLFCEVKMGHTFHYAGNFEVYDLNQHQRSGTVFRQGVVLQGDFPHRSYIYVAIPNGGVYRAVLRNNST